MPLLRIAGILLSISLLLPPGPVRAAQVRNISADQARKIIATMHDLFLLDVRTPQEYAEVRLDGARLIPINDLITRIAEVPKDRPILVYCAVGSRSSRVADYLARSGYPDVYNLIGGIWAWQLRGYPVLKGRP
ncbi:rhodanese-like domain-containing protein [Geothermobacter hydrogeniphilus]|uniref:Rhodanese-like domain-containing protein n=1 Tax=Geothermobacter hydrogeniphilus TaxID=1969733 RepID=A0A2K2HD97_9BACT|nr:rhodanese-like domain-containing protein [Geothermobacter hydrogeniphilus]PNU21260.1 rhodanese-like domain-containing protein [Geothermobacter hydrogeniphilus]